MPETPREPLDVDLRGLTRRYGVRRGVEAVTLAVPRGSLFGFLGPNGAGKTTVIRVILGFLRPTEGTARAMGLDCWRESHKVKAQVGSIPGDLRLWPWLNGHSALKLFSRIRGVDMVKGGRRLAEQLDLDLGVRVRAMSRGMRQKLGLILALAHDPGLLVLDEPTTALDPLMQDRLREILHARAAAGRTVFFSSHTLSEVEAICQRVAIVRQGRIVADSTLDELKRQAGHDVEIVFRAGAGAAAPPAGLTLSRRSPDRWAGEHRGPLEPLLSFLAGVPVEDVTIRKPDLEQLFRRYYDAPGGEGAGG
ncbi:MAG: ABC transporter ATP-binding protein [Phycisphaeraceae bacterium]|nr:MAG: ABC transporter ATP-binding protein [Phycisphaeraceae bacterium]